MEQFSVATTSSGQGGSTINATVDLIPCRAPVELNANQLEVSFYPKLYWAADPQLHFHSYNYVKQPSEIFP